MNPTPSLVSPSHTSVNFVSKKIDKEYLVKTLYFMTKFIRSSSAA